MAVIFSYCTFTTLAFITKNYVNLIRLLQVISSNFFIWLDFGQKMLNKTLNIYNLIDERCYLFCFLFFKLYININWSEISFVSKLTTQTGVLDSKLTTLGINLYKGGVLCTGEILCLPQSVLTVEWFYIVLFNLI